MSSKKIKILLASLMSVTLIAAATSTVSWFVTRQSVDTTGKMGGSVLQSYFNRGSGTASDPFTITTPWHYENFVKLHYTVDDFADGGFYFQFGDTLDSSGQPMPGSPTSPVFYKTNEYGIVDYSQTDTTLNLGGMNLPPLGSEGKPFFGQIEGNGLTVKNFNINSLVNDKTANDIGIFGYVSSKTIAGGGTQRAKINGCYWSDFKINTQKQAPDYFVHEEEAHKHDDTVEVGYLAGHVVDAGSFTNCYVNRCTIDSKAPSMAINNTFGYYGKAEIDSVGGQTGKGHDYHFVLDSEAAYRTLNDNYNTLRGYPLRTRVEENDNFWYAKKSTDTSVQSGKNYYTRVVSSGKYNPGELDDGQYIYRLIGSPSGNPSSQNYYEIINDGQKHYADYDPPFSMPEFVNNAAKYPLSDAITRNGTNTYNLNGKTLNDKSAPYNYSLASLGYQPLKGGEQHEYEVTYNNGKIASENTEQKIDAAPINEQKGTSDYYRMDYGRWQYQHTENNMTSEREKKEFNFSISYDSSFNVNLDGTMSAVGSPSMDSYAAYLYIDDVSYPLTISRISLSRPSSRVLAVSNFTLTGIPTKLNLNRGVHHYTIFVVFHTNKERAKYVVLKDNVSAYSRDRNKFTISSANTFEITQSDFEATKAISINWKGDNCSKTPYYVLNIADPGSPTIVNNSLIPFDEDTIPPYVSPNSFQYELSGKNTKTSEITVLEDTSLTFETERYSETIQGVIDGFYYNQEFYATYDEKTKNYSDKISPEIGKIYRDKGNNNKAYYWNGSSYLDNFTNGYYWNDLFFSDPEHNNEIGGIEGNYYYDLTAGGYYRFTNGKFNDVNQINKYRWLAHDNPAREVDYDADPVYIGDHPTLVESGFDHENIDIVGGGVSFYYLERVLFWDVNIKVLTLPSETTTNYMVEAVTKDDLGKEFYSTKYCPGSVVMYIKNFSNAADNIDHELGNIKFRYANMEIGGRSRVNLEKPAFKKGSGNFVDITQMGTEKSSGQTISLQTEFECDITEAGAKKACYCALDKVGHILGVFDNNGNPGMGFLNEDGTVNIDKLLAIDTYVVTLGASANASFLPTWITRVEFSYKAKQGFGGTFGTVGYRDVPGTVPSTILNFNYNSPVDNPFIITVEFRDIEEPIPGGPIGTYYITVQSRDKVTLNIFNYNTAQYNIVINGGDPQNNSNIEIDVQGTLT